MGVIRHADAGYERALEVAAERGVRIPMREIVTDRHLVAMGGGGFSMDDPILDRFVLELVDASRPNVCFLPTATSAVPVYAVAFFQAFPATRFNSSFLDLFVRDGRDLRAFMLEQDVIYVGGGNTANLLAIWRAHGVDAILREAWEAGVVLAGIARARTAGSKEARPIRSGRSRRFRTAWD